MLVLAAPFASDFAYWFKLKSGLIAPTEWIQERLTARNIYGSSCEECRYIEFKSSILNRLWRHYTITAHPFLVMFDGCQSRARLYSRPFRARICIHSHSGCIAKRSLPTAQLSKHNRQNIHTHSIGCFGLCKWVVLKPLTLLGNYICRASKFQEVGDQYEPHCANKISGPSLEGKTTCRRAPFKAGP